MPVLDFQNPETGKIISVLVPITAPDKERHEQIGDDGKVYKRVYSAPNAAIDSRVTDASKEEFRKLTSKKGVTVGDMWEISDQMSRHRADKNGGVDEVKEKFYKDYEKKFGRPHDDITRRAMKQRTDYLEREWGIKIEDA